MELDGIPCPRIDRCDLDTGGQEPADPDLVVDLFGQLPLLREVLHEKLSDPGMIWEQNDLTDMMYLSCGTAYAHHVVGERPLISDLRRAPARSGRHINVHPKLADLVLAVGR